MSHQDGDTALSFARSKGHHHIEDLLRNASGQAYKKVCIM